MTDMQTTLKSFTFTYESKNKWNGQKQKKKKRETPYLRRCRRCEMTYKTPFKTSKICSNCKKTPDHKKK